MVRTTQTRKRSRSRMPFRGVKRRRFTRRLRRGRYNTSYTSRQNNSSNGFRLRARLLPKRLYRRQLWNQTNPMQHYRSIFSGDSPTLVQTPTGVANINCAITPAMLSALNFAFWKLVGGFQDPGFGRQPNWCLPPGAGVNEPLNIVIRGGRFWITIANPSLTDTVNVRVQLAYAKQQETNAADSALSNALPSYITALTASNPRPISWSAQAGPDYGEYFYAPILDKTFDMKPGDDMMVMQRLRPKKIDATQFERGSGSLFPYWFIYAGQRVDTTAGQNTLNCTIGHNLSFAVTNTLNN